MGEALIGAAISAAAGMYAASTQADAAKAAAKKQADATMRASQEQSRLAQAQASQAQSEKAAQQARDAAAAQAKAALDGMPKVEAVEATLGTETDENTPTGKKGRRQEFFQSTGQGYGTTSGLQI